MQKSILVRITKTYSKEDNLLNSCSYFCDELLSSEIIFEICGRKLLVVNKVLQTNYKKVELKDRQPIFYVVIECKFYFVNNWFLNYIKREFYSRQFVLAEHLVYSL